MTLTKCSLPGEAHAIRMRLESEGIPVFLFDEFTITMDWLLSNAIGGIKIQIPDHELARAQQILGLMEEDEEEVEAQKEDAPQEDTSSEDQPPQEGIIDKNSTDPVS